MDSTSDGPFRIAIVGGGIGGLFTALSIQHFCSSYNIETQVYEQAREYREIGSGVGLGVNAARILHAIGLGEQVNAIAGRQKGAWISFRRFDDGKDIITIPQDDEANERQAPVHRAEYLDLLYRATLERKAAQLHVRKRCFKVAEEKEGIRLDFRDGTSAVADLVIGADGIHSSVREHYIKDNAVYSGQIAYRGTIPMDKVNPWWTLPTHSINWVAKGRHLLVYPISQNKVMNVVAFVSIPHEDLEELQESWSSDGSRDELLHDMEGFEPTAVRLLQLLPDRVAKRKLNDRDPFEPWVFGNGRILLLGDAAHAILPHQGSGAGQAMEDGYVLGRCLQDYLKTTQDANDADTRAASLEKYTSLYQTVRLPRAQKVQTTSREAGQIYEFQTDEMKGRSYTECLPTFAKIMQGRMDWIWGDDLDASYEKGRSAMVAD